MRLSEFIRQHHVEIGRDWEAFARELSAFAQGLNLPSLRDHLDAILQAIVDDMEQPESAEQRRAKSMGHGPPGALESNYCAPCADPTQRGLQPAPCLIGVPGAARQRIKAMGAARWAEQYRRSNPLQRDHRSGDCGSIEAS